MSYQKIKPCPVCGCKYLSVYSYDSGWRYVECDSGNGCVYRGPGAGSIKSAIKLHNVKAGMRDAKAGAA